MIAALHLTGATQHNFYPRTSNFWKLIKTFCPRVEVYQSYVETINTGAISKIAEFEGKLQNPPIKS
jgi:hypothetical protein